MSATAIQQPVETVEFLHDAQQIAAHVVRMLMVQGQTVPEFPCGDVPVPVAARVYGKDANWVRAGIICGWLPIGRATRDKKPVTDLEQMNSKYGRIDYQISAKKLWEDTGYIWKGEKK